jgi:hypothetical protein
MLPSVRKNMSKNDCLGKVITFDFIKYDVFCNKLLLYICKIIIFVQLA